MMIKYKGSVEIVNKSTGVTLSFENIVTNGFYNLVADRLINNSENFITHFAVGDNATSVAITDTAMGNETFRKEITNVSSVGAQIELQTDILGNEAIGSWKEIGLFNASTVGTLTNHTNVDFSHTAGDLLTVVWKIDKV